MKNVIWKWRNGSYVPFCPYCGEPAHNQDECIFCGRTYNYILNAIIPVEVTADEYTAIQTTNNHIFIYKDAEIICHMQCYDWKTENELIELIESYKRWLKKKRE